MDAERGTPRFRAALVLAAIALAAAALIAGTERLTRDRIAQNQIDLLARQFEPVLSGTAYDDVDVMNPLRLAAPELTATGATIDVWQARRDGRTVAVVLGISRIGYSGPIVLLVGIDTGGSVTGVRVAEHRETPGLGDLIERERSDWITQFDGLRLGAPRAEAWQLQQDGGAFDAFTGASVTPRAVVTLIRDALLYFDANKHRLIDPASQEN